MTMIIKTQITDVATFEKMVSRAVSEDLASEIESFFETQLKHLASTGKSDSYKQFVVYAVNEAEKIIGFRYFYFEPSKQFCEMFMTFVDFDYRRKGVAGRLIEKAFDVAAENGRTRFRIPIGVPETEEKNGLLNWYRRFAKANSHKFSFTIYHPKGEETYGPA